MDLEYTLMRTDRRTVAIRILADGTVEVRAPRRLSKKAIENFIFEKKDWIEKHRQEILSRKPEDIQSRRILFKGEWYDMQPTDRDIVGFDGQCFYASPSLTAEELVTGMEALMKKLAKQYLVPQTMQKAVEMGLCPQKIGITSAKTKWASCTGATNINFSWRLMAAPPDVIDYVIVHELCHMTEMNHSNRFWALVERQCPDWKALRDKLPTVQAWLDGYYGR